MFMQNEIEKMGAVFYAQGQNGIVPCVACGSGEVEFSTQGNPVFGMVQVYTLRCDHCGRTGKHPN